MKIATDPKWHLSRGWGAEWLQRITEGAVGKLGDGASTDHNCQCSNES